MSDVHFRPKNQFDPRRKSPMTACGKYYFDVSEWSEDPSKVTCDECEIQMAAERSEREP